jgi:N-formylglutamate deformylase
MSAMSAKTLPIFVTIPHSGERVPEECDWLKGLPEPVLMSDVDRYVDKLYEPAIKSLDIPCVKTEWHRYAVDLNRLPEDIDQGSVEGAKEPMGKNSRGYHWVHTTQKQQLMPKPMSESDHHKLTKKIYEPFHQAVRSQYASFHQQGIKQVLHLDLHSMPSVGTSEHRDPGESRADIVVSDCLGKSANSELVNLVLVSYARAGFKVGYNWPYFGGRLSEQYGQPLRGQHAIQVELNRKLYMDEVSKQQQSGAFEKTQQKLTKALVEILSRAPVILATAV